MNLWYVLQGAALVLALEGMVYALAPGAMRRGLAMLAATPEARLRMGGLIAAVIGVGLAWLLKGA